MKKILFLSVVALTLFIVGCGGILIKPDVYSVKKLAIVSIYMNREFYNIKSPTADEGVNWLGALVKSEVKGFDKLYDQKEYKQIITYALKVYAKQLHLVGQWKVLSPARVIKNKKYKYAMNTAGIIVPFVGDIVDIAKKEMERKWVTPPGMHFVPMSSMAEPGKTVHYGSKKNPVEENRKKIAKICRDLKVDGLAIIELDMGYRFGKLVKLTIGKTTQAKPSISSAMIIITKEGNIAVKTPFIVKGQGRRYEGKSAGMIVNDKFRLKHKRGKTVHAFNVAVKKSAIGLKEQIEKEFQKR